MLQVNYGAQLALVDLTSYRRSFEANSHRAEAAVAGLAQVCVSRHGTPHENVPYTEYARK